MKKSNVFWIIVTMVVLIVANFLLFKPNSSYYEMKEKYDNEKVVFTRTMVNADTEIKNSFKRIDLILEDKTNVETKLDKAIKEGDSIKVKYERKLKANQRDFERKIIKVETESWEYCEEWLKECLNDKNQIKLKNYNDKVKLKKEITDLKKQIEDLTTKFQLRIKDLEDDIDGLLRKGTNRLSVAFNYNLYTLGQDFNDMPIGGNLISPHVLSIGFSYKLFDVPNPFKLLFSIFRKK